jgi:hypothetical protein
MASPDEISTGREFQVRLSEQVLRGNHMKPLVCQRYKNVLRVLMRFWFECKRDLYFSGGEIVQSESEEVIGRTSEQRLRAKRGEKEPQDLIGLRPL